jgi:hypothetical protein
MDGKVEIHSGHIKTGLMHYFRLKRGWICADEVKSGAFIGDIIVDTGKYTMEVEIKTSKSDLVQGEAKKNVYFYENRVRKVRNKHDLWRESRTNKFALCVPVSLKEVAEEWIDKTNTKYGLYVYTEEPTQTYGIITYKRAGFLHKNYDPKKYLYKIARRLSNCRAFELSSRLRKKT